MACWCESRRSHQLKQHFKEENERLSMQGVAMGQVASAPRHMPYVLTWIPDVRPQFEAREPGVRQYVREGLPPAFWLEKDKKAWHELLLAAPDPGSSSAAGK
jgi:hypothetical protein